MVLTDEELIERIQTAVDREQAGRHAGELLGRYSTRVVSWCWKFSNHRDTATDLAQEVLFKAYRSLDNFRYDSKFSTWLYTITRNHCLNYVKARGTQPVDLAGPLDLEPQDSRDWDVLATLQQERELQSLRLLMKQTLDDTEAKVMLLHYGEEMPLEGVTRVLGLTNQSGAKAYIVSAKRKLAVAVRRWRARNQEVN